MRSPPPGPGTLVSAAATAGSTAVTAVSAGHNALGTAIHNTSHRAAKNSSIGQRRSSAIEAPGSPPSIVPSGSLATAIPSNGGNAKAGGR
jgi:hypothetical protein